MSDLAFKALTFRNFMSFGNVPVTFDLSKPGTVFITGENLDDGGSSGAGKTTLINALSYVLFDKVPTKISKERLINRTNKDNKKTLMEVELTLQRGSDEYIIKRFRGAETGYNLVHVNHPDEPNKDITNAGGFNTSIEELLGFSYELFKQIILFDGNSTPFLDLGASDQRALIEELLKITLLSRKADALKKTIDETDKAIDIQKALIEQQKVQVERQKKQVQDAEARVVKWEEQRDLQASQLKQSIAKVKEVDFETEEALHAEIAALKAELAPLEAELKALNAEWSALTKALERSPVATELALNASRNGEIRKQASKISTELAHLKDAKCPYCLQKYADAQAKIEEIETAGNKLRLEAEDLAGQHSILREQEAAHVKKHADELSKLGEAIQAKKQVLETDKQTLQEVTAAVRFPSLEQTLREKESLRTLTDRLAKLQSEDNPHVEALDELLKNSDAKVNTDELDALVRLKDHQVLLRKLLTDKNSYIRKAIISKTLPFLNKRIAFYTEKLGLPHVVKFMPDMSCEITQMGRDLDHGNLSNGQKKRLNLSLCFAFRDALTYLHSKVNVLFTDEIDGGSLDEQSINAMISLLKHKAWDDTIGIYIISHRPEFDGRCDRNVVVRLEAGFSTLIEQVD